jgi:hypothetical protein
MDDVAPDVLNPWKELLDSFVFAAGPREPFASAGLTVPLSACPDEVPNPVSVLLVLVLSRPLALSSRTGVSVAELLGGADTFIDEE